MTARGDPPVVAGPADRPRRPPDPVARVDERRLGGALERRPAADLPARRAPARRAASDLGALLLFDFNNIRYVTSTHIGEWARDKMTRYALLTRGGDPHLWDFGSAAKHHRLNCPWLRAENVHAGMIGLRGAVAPDAGLFRGRRERDRRHPARRGRRRHAARRRHRRAADARRPRGRGDHRPRRPAGRCSTPARSSRSTRSSCSTPPARWSTAPTSSSPSSSSPASARASSSPTSPRPCSTWARARRQHQRGVRRALQPAPARLQRPAHPPRRPGLLRHHPDVRRLQDLLLPDVRRRHGERRPARRVQAGARVDRRLDRADAAGRRHRPGREGLAEGRGVRLLNEMECFGLQFGHSVGLFLHERPIISRLNSLDHPVEIKEGMVIALETYCPAKDGYSAARIEEEVVVTADGPQVITRFPSATSCSSPTRTDGDGVRDRGAPRPTELDRGSGSDVPDDGRVPAVRGRGPRSCSSRAWSAGRPTSASARRRWRPGSPPRCAPTTTRSARTAATTTRWRGRADGAALRRAVRAGDRAPGRQGRLDAPHRVEHGMMGSYAIVGAHLPIALGAAWSAQYRKSGQVAVCFFGDGTTNIGAFHEALNMAAVWKAPVVFVCENNQYMEYTPIGAVTAVAAAGGGPGQRLRPRADRRRRQRRRGGVRGRAADDRAGARRRGAVAGRGA